MSKSLSPLKTTTPDLHRFYVSLTTPTQWYAVMRECRVWFGTDWRTQPKIRRRLERNFDNPVEAWFEVPNPEWATWIATKLSLEVCSNAKFDNKKNMTTNFKWPILELDFDKISSLSQSQAGQDLFVVAITQGKKNGRWLEIGSGHPKWYNNTWLLEKEFSWTGDSIDCINPGWSPKQKTWFEFYRNIRACFGNAIPSEWIPNPKNLEALPNHVQQELIELHGYDFYVGKLSDDPNILHIWDKERPNANSIIADAFDLHFANFQGPYDYLQIDIDNHANHCKLLQSIIQFHEFSVITFEHDFFQKTSDTALCRNQSRQILQSAGYILLCTDVTVEPGKGWGIDNEPIYFEDWYVHPSRVHKEIIDTYKFVSKYPRPLYYTHILFSGK